MSRLPRIAEVFAVSSILSFGGTNAIVPHLRREVVSDYAWVSDDGFAEAYALAQVTPGPSTTIVTLLGYQAGGVFGAVIATVAMILPSCALAFLFAWLWQVTGAASWHKILERGLEPVGIGLIASAGLVLSHAVDHDAIAWIVTAAACAALTFTNMNPLVVVALGGLIGLINP